MAPEFSPIEIDGYIIVIVQKYEPVSLLGELILARQVFETREKAEEHAERARRILADLGKWEQLILALRNVRESVDGETHSMPEPVKLDDLKIFVQERKMHPFKVLIDLADDATTAIARTERPWLQKSETWVSALENLKRWRFLRESLQALR